MGSLPVSQLLPPQSAHTGGCSASLAIVDGLNEFQRRGELHPPIALLPTQPAGIEIIDVLNGGQQAGRVCPYEDKDKHRDKVISSRDGVFIGQAEEVHDRGTHTQYTLDFVSWRLVCIDGSDLRLC